MALIPYLTAGEDLRDDAYWNTLFEELDRKLNIALDNHSMCFWFSQLNGRLFDPFFGQCFFFHDPNPYFSTLIFNTAGSGYTQHQEDFSDFLLGPNALFSEKFDFVNYNHTPFTNAANTTALDSTFVPSVDHTRKIVRLQQVADSFYTQIGRSPNLKLRNIGLFHWSLEAMTRIVLNPSTGQADRYKVFVRNDPGPELIRRHASVELIYEGPTYTNVVFPRNYNKFNFFRIHNLNGTAMTFTFKGSSNQNVFTLTIPAYGSKCVRRDDVNSGYLEGFSHFHRFKSGDYRFYSAPLPLGSETGYENVIGFKRKAATKGNNVVNPQLAFSLVWRMAASITSDSRGPAHWYLDPTRFWDASSLYCPEYFEPVANSTLLGNLLHHKGTIGLAKINSPTTATKASINFTGYGTLPAALAAAGFTGVSINSSGITATKTGEHDLLSVSSNFISARYGQPATTFTNSITFDCVDIQNDAQRAAQPLNLATTANTFTYKTFTINSNNRAVVTGTPSVTMNTKALVDAGNNAPVPNIPYHQTTVADLLTLNTFGVTEFNSSIQETQYTDHADRQVKLTGFGLVLTWNKRVSPWKINGVREWAGGTLAGGVMLSSHPSNGLAGFDGSDFIRRKYVHFSGYGWPTWRPIFDVNQRLAQPFHGAFQSPRKEPRWGKFRFMLKTQANADIYFGSLNGSNFSFRQPLHPDFTHTYEKQTADDSTLKVKLAGKPTKKGIRVLTDFSLLNVYGIIGAWHSGGTYTPNINPTTGQPSTYSFPTPDAYMTYRSQITNNNPSGLRYLNGPLVFDRMPLLVDHYNNLASVVNAIHKIQPLHFAAFYDLLNNTVQTTGIFGTTIRPANQFAAFTGVDISLSNPRYAALVNLGIPVRTAINFPVSYNQLLNAKKRRVRAVPSGETYSIQFEELTADPLLDSTWKGILFNSTIATQGDYRWFTIEDVKAKATALGFKFYFQSACVPLKLTITDATGTSVLYDAPGSNAQSGETIARFPAFVNSETSDEIEWVKTIDVPRVRANYEPADVFTFRPFGFGGSDILEVVTDAKWRKRNWSTSGNIYATQPYYAFDQSYFSFLFINELPAGETSSSKIIANSTTYIDFGANFSRQSPANAIARQDIGLLAIPGTVQNTTDGRAIASTTAGNNFITATSFPAADLTFFVDTLKDA